jgi:hypothetical protein
MPDLWKRHVVLTDRQLAYELDLGGDHFRVFTELDVPYVHIIGESYDPFPGAFHVDALSHVDHSSFYYQVQNDASGNEISRVRHWVGGKPIPSKKQIT